MSNLKDAAQKKYGCRWSELHETTREDFEAGWLAAQEALAQPDDNEMQPVVPDYDDFVDCDECNGVGFRDVERQVAERKSDVQTFREQCEVCNGSGKEYKGEPLYTAPQPPAKQGAELSDEQMVALQKAWYGVGADMAGLKWGDFVAVLAADRAARGGAA